MIPSNILVNKSTKKNIETYLDSPFSVLALIGLPGNGKTFMAKNLAEYILNENNQTNFSIIELSAKGTGIDEIREVQKKLNLKTFGINKVRRVVVISDFDSYTNPAQNALLKTFEEPPADTLIIITINNEKKVLETIFSRVKKIYIKPITKSDIPLQITKKYSEKEVAKAFSLSMGQPAIFVGLLEGKEGNELLLALDTAKEILRLPKYQQIAKVDAIVKNKNENFAYQFCDCLVRIFKASLDNLIQSTPIKDKDLEKAHNRLSYVNECMKSIELGLNKKLALTRLLIKL